MEKHTIVMIGVGGMGMCPLAIYLSQQGYNLLGWEDTINPIVEEKLKFHGIHWLKNIDQVKRSDYVIYSSAISPEHPIYKAAVVAGVPLMRRGEFLAKVLENKKLIAVVGSHGKTTTTGLLIHALEKAGFDFGYLLGALFRDKKWLPARASDSDWVVAEIDESDGTIEGFSPEITLAINLDWDHMSQYPTTESLEATFKSLFQRTRKAVYLPKESDLLVRLAEGIECSVHCFGKNSTYSAKSYQLVPSGMEVELSDSLNKEKEISQQFFLPMQGRFNLENTLAALAVYIDLTKKFPKSTFEDFQGIQRRQDALLDRSGLSVIADYAHHPSEVAHLVSSLSEGYQKPLVVVFQPHRYTRTAALAEAFAAVFKSPSIQAVHLLPVYAASEFEFPKSKSDVILNHCQGKGFGKKVILSDCYESLESELLNAIRGDLTIAFIGAGDIEKWAHRFKKRIEEDAWWLDLKSSLTDSTKWRLSEPLATKTTMRVGGPARYYCEPANREDLKLILSSSRSVGCPLFVLGRGSNVIVPDEGYNGLVIKLNHAEWSVCELLTEGRVWVGGGLRIKELCGKLLQLGLSGFEFLEGIPGTVGGALRMNAGAMGQATFDIVERVRVMTYEGQELEFAKEDLSVSYRKCEELNNMIVLGAIVQLAQKKNKEFVQSTLANYSVKRKKSQPRESSAGCMFKNPEGDHAGRLIDALGLKGSSEGLAAVSSIHGNFIINKSGATSKDVLGLVKKVHKQVYDASGIKLEPEVLILGQNWNNLLEGAESIS